MVGLSDMETTLSNCIVCQKEGVTKCDKCNTPTCRKCLSIIPVPPSVSETLIQVMHIKCAPKKHLAKAILLDDKEVIE